MQSFDIVVTAPKRENDYCGSKTEQNLWAAFAGESMARNRYSYYASVARKAGYEQMAEIFEQTANNEKEHAKIWFKMLGQISQTPRNLLMAADSENFEWTNSYREMAQVAYEEGFDYVATLFEGVAAIEKYHEKRFRKLFHMLDSGEVFRKTGLVMWECRNCGHICIAESAPETCPVCSHPQGFFQLRQEDNL